MDWKTLAASMTPLMAVLLPLVALGWRHWSSSDWATVVSIGVAMLAAVWMAWRHAVGLGDRAKLRRENMRLVMRSCGASVAPLSVNCPFTPGADKDL